MPAAGPTPLPRAGVPILVGPHAAGEKSARSARPATTAPASCATTNMPTRAAVIRTAALYPLSYGGAVLPSYPTRAGGAVTDKPAARRVVLYERSGCHLCDEVRVLLDAMLGHDAYERVDVDTDDALVLRYGFRVPVVSVDGVDRLEAPMSAAELRSLLA